MTHTASIHSIALEDQARAESAAWAQFSAPADNIAFCRSWLAILCSQVDRVNGALLLLRADDQGAFAVSAVWPDAGRDMQYLGPVAHRTLTEGRGLASAPDGVSPPSADHAAYVGYPIRLSGALEGAVVLDLAARGEADLQHAMRVVHWGTAWLVDDFRQREQAKTQAHLDRISLATDLVASTLQEKQFGPAAMAVANELAARLGCERVSLGWEHAGSVRVDTISHTATFDDKAELVRRIGAAMDEVLDLDVALAHPPDAANDLGQIAHAELANTAGDAGIVSVPLVDAGTTCGVLTLERTDSPFDAGEQELAHTLGLLLGPILTLKREADRGWLARLRSAAVEHMGTVFGPRHPGAKLIAFVVVALIAVLTVVKTDYRVNARTVIEGAVQRAAVAPFDGYVAQSLVRAGDRVTQGQVLCRLDDRDLRLERTRTLSEREQLLRKHRQAFAAGERASMTVLAAQISQTEAQLALVEDKLARATLVAPFDGVVVSGDLSQRLGSPVQLGDALFEVAPLDAYRVVLQVDERDIMDLSLGQPGNLVLSGIANEAMPFTVEQITPVATAADGHNYFRVEARLLHPPERLRPGMEGVGKVDAGERRLIWIWTHRLVDWLQLWAWNWLP